MPYMYPMGVGMQPLGPPDVSASHAAAPWDREPWGSATTSTQVLPAPAQPALVQVASAPAPTVEQQTVPHKPLADELCPQRAAPMRGRAPQRKRQRQLDSAAVFVEDAALGVADFDPLSHADAHHARTEHRVERTGVPRMPVAASTVRTSPDTRPMTRAGGGSPSPTRQASGRRAPQIHSWRALLCEIRVGRGVRRPRTARAARAVVSPTDALDAPDADAADVDRPELEAHAGEEDAHGESQHTHGSLL